MQPTQKKKMSISPQQRSRRTKSHRRRTKSHRRRSPKRSYKSRKISHRSKSYNRRRKQYGSGGTCIKVPPHFGIADRVKKFWQNLPSLSISPSEMMKNMSQAWSDSDIAVEAYQQMNLENWRKLTAGKIKIALPLTLRLRKDWGQNLPKQAAQADTNWVKISMLWHYRCKAYDTQGNSLDLAFAFNLEELIRQMAMVAYYQEKVKNLQSDMIPPPIWLNPVTQDNWTSDDLTDMQAAYEKASREIKNQLTLAEKYSSYLSYAGILATGVAAAAPYLIPAYVTTLFAINVLVWALPLASAAVSTADRWFNKYDTMSYEQKAATISNLDSIVALAGTAVTKNEKWLETGLYGTVPIPKSYLIVSQIVVPLGVKALTLYLRQRDINQDTNTTAFNRSLAKEINNTEYTRHANSGGATTIEDIRTNIQTAAASKGNDNEIIPQQMMMTGGQRRRR